MNIWLAEIWRAWRASLRRPGFLLLASGVLALGVGASTAVFTLIENTLLRPLPVSGSSQLVVIGSWNGRNVGTISPRYYQQLDTIPGIASVGLKQAGSMTNIVVDGKPVQVARIYASRQLLPTLGMQPILGRNFTAQEDRPGGAPSVMISHGFWQRRYGADPHIIGTRLRVEGVYRTIVGVLPATFNVVAGRGSVVVPMALPAVSNNNGGGSMAIARLAKGASVSAVAAEVDARLHALDLAMPGADTMPRLRYGTQALADWLHRDTRPVLRLFQASAALVLLIVLVNLTNLMLLRRLARGHDTAVRSALGASLSRLVLPALGEGLLVGMCGALLGMALASGGLALLQKFIPAQWLVDGEVHVSVHAWVLAIATGMLVALLAAAFGLWRSRDEALLEVLREGGRNGIGRHAGRLGRVLVMAQVAVAAVLLVAAGLFAHALYTASRMPLGFVGDKVLTFELAPVAADYPDAAAVENLAQQLVRQLRAIPGVTDAAVTTNLPTSTDDIGSFGQFMSGVQVPGGSIFAVQYHGVGPDFFNLFSIRLRKGRYFTRGDVRGSTPVAIVSKNLADTRYGGDAIGKVINVNGQDNAVWPLRIVGVVGDTWQYGPLQPSQPVLYVPLAQMPAPELAVFRRFEPLRFVLRGHGDPNAWRPEVRAAVAAVAPAQPIANMRTMSNILRATLAGTRLNLLLIGLFAVLALLLAAAGLYAVMAVAVAAREREFGVRMALGAAPLGLLRLVLRAGLVQIAIGLVVGVIAALALSHVLSALLTELLGQSSMLDPVVIFGVCALLGVSGLLACFIPAIRAGRVQPMRALRGE